MPYTDKVILIAEDDEGHVALIRKNLDRCGITNHVEHFFDGQQVLDYMGSRYLSSDLCASADECVLLMDIRMPKVDGISVLRKMKSDPALKAIPVVMVTTTDDPMEIERCMTLGCTGYLIKPLDRERFCESMASLGLIDSDSGNGKCGQ